MPRVKENLEKVTIRLTKGAASELDGFYPNVGYNKVIRKLVDNHIKSLNERVNQERSQNHDELNLNDELSID